MTEDKETIDQANIDVQSNGASAAQDAEQAATEVAQPSELDELRARIAQLEKEAAEYKDQWLRAAADYKNFKRRSETERAELIRSASAGLLLKLLPVIDDLERALNSVTPEI